MALIASLIFVGIETRNSTEQAALANQTLADASVQAVTAQLMDWHLALDSSEDLSRLVMTTESTPAEVSGVEWARFTTLTVPLYGMWEWSFISYRDNSIENAQWLALDAFFSTFTCTPGHQRFMDENAAAYSAQFVDHYQSELEMLCTTEKSTADVVK